MDHRPAQLPPPPNALRPPIHSASTYIRPTVYHQTYPMIPTYGPPINTRYQMYQRPMPQMINTHTYQPHALSYQSSLPRTNHNSQSDVIQIGEFCIDK